MSREELIALVEERDAQIATLSTQVADLARANERLAAKLASLEHLLSRNSQNSSLPPSRDDDLGRTSPALKCCPAPVSMTTATSGIAESRASTSGSSCHVSMVSALRLAGLSMVKVAIGPGLSTRTRPAMDLGVVSSSAGKAGGADRDGPLRLAGVAAERLDEAVGGEVFHDVGGPAGDAAHHEDGCKGGDVKAHQVVGRTAGVIEVGVDVHALEHGSGHGTVGVHE